eukprot:3885151-Amphidinium_carterae.2
MATANSSRQGALSVQEGKAACMLVMVLHKSDPCPSSPVVNTSNTNQHGKFCLEVSGDSITLRCALCSVLNPVPMNDDLWHCRTVICSTVCPEPIPVALPG